MLKRLSPESLSTVYISKAGDDDDDPQIVPWKVQPAMKPGWVSWTAVKTSAPGGDPAFPT